MTKREIRRLYEQALQDYREGVTLGMHYKDHPTKSQLLLWKENNIAFNAGKDAALNGRPSTSIPIDVWAEVLAMETKHWAYG